MPTRINPPLKAFVGVTFSPNPMTPTVATVTTSQLAMIA
jgi:hypothetical protein